MRLVVYVVGAIYLSTALIMFFAPLTFYNSTPGVAMMGPLNLHFIRDAALAFLVSGLALIHGARTFNKTALIFGAAWPCLHALFHIWIWFGRGVPVDLVSATNLFAIQLPAWLALTAALTLSKRSI